MSKWLTVILKISATSDCSLFLKCTCVNIFLCLFIFSAFWKNFRITHYFHNFCLFVCLQETNNLQEADATVLITVVVTRNYLCVLATICQQQNLQQYLVSVLLIEKSPLVIPSLTFLIFLLLFPLSPPVHVVFVGTSWKLSFLFNSFNVFLFHSFNSLFLLSPSPLATPSIYPSPFYPNSYWLPWRLRWYISVKRRWWPTERHITN
jgi:hypothetical protein